MPILEDIKEEDLFGPVYRKRYLEAKGQGREEGRLEGERHLLRKQVTLRFGTLPAWAESRLNSLTEPEIEEASVRLFGQWTLTDVLNPPAE